MVFPQRGRRQSTFCKDSRTRSGVSFMYLYGFLCYQCCCIIQDHSRFTIHDLRAYSGGCNMRFGDNRNAMLDLRRYLAGSDQVEDSRASNYPAPTQTHALRNGRQECTVLPMENKSENVLR